AMPAVNPIYIIQGEVYGLLSHLKLNSRWSNQYQSLVPENAILRSLKNLANILHNESDTCTYLEPFLLVIRSAETSGPITGTALTSVNKFLTQFIDTESINAPKAIRLIAESVSHCRFEETDSRSDEVVLMKICQVLSSCVRNTAGIYLSNELIYETMHTCYLMTDRPRSSELLKKTAESALQDIVVTVFQHYNVFTAPPTPPPPPPPSIITDKPYDETVLTKIFSFFVGNINPATIDNDMIRLLSLNTINIIVQMKGQQLEATQDILAIIKDKLLKLLLLNLQARNIPVFSLTMRIFFNLFVALRQNLKAQFEEFFHVLLKSIVDNRHMFELQELALEGLRDFCKLPLAMVELFINYDCELYSGNVFELLCKTLYKHSFPLSGQLNTLHMLSLENLLSIVQSIDDRSKYPKYIQHSLHPVAHQLEHMHRKKYKQQMLVAAEHFNRRPNDAFDYLIENNIYPVMNATNIAKFLLETPKLNKVKVGEYLGKRSNNEVLSSYMNYFNEKYPSFMLSFRNFLESFKISGEAAVVEFTFDMFASKAYAQLVERGDNTFKDADQICVYLYSGLMLHTSTFNQNVTQCIRRCPAQSFSLMRTHPLQEQSPMHHGDTL
ncbi:hypothetical protein SAMD00019534_000120, partial [Acytostelium subglobosum LB1]|uniref:hypothetical protein n=1 Tax=Acytostelium subglobosum LB1 TaxID=1410327 RepID=UPI0006449A0C